MSPEIRIVERGLQTFEERCSRIKSPVVREELIADVPDITGVYSTRLGPISINLDELDPTKEVQVMILKLGKLDFDRQVHLSPNGRGVTVLNDRTKAVVQLHDPIRRPGEWRREVVGNEIVKRPTRYGTVFETVKHHGWRKINP